MQELPGSKTLAADGGRRSSLQDFWGESLSLPQGPELVLNGRYRLQGLLGQGGMGLVYEATQLAVGTPVAIKMLRPELLGQAEYVRRFREEGRCLAALSNEHVVRVIEAGQLDSGLPFIVMERLEGMTLAELLAGRAQLSASAAVDYAMQVCAGLAAVHARNLVHLDVKPANLFLVARGGLPSTLKILDFGVARWLEGATPAPTAVDLGSQIASPRYASPEQLDDPECIDERSDVWSLGVVLFEMLTGTTPFVGSGYTEIYTRVLLVPTPAMSALRPELDRRLVAVIETCLEKDAARRFASVQALSAALAACRSDAAHEREPCPPRSRARATDVSAQP